MTACPTSVLDEALAPDLLDMSLRGELDPSRDPGTAWGGEVPAARLPGGTGRDTPTACTGRRSDGAEPNRDEGRCSRFNTNCMQMMIHAGMKLQLIPPSWSENAVCHLLFAAMTDQASSATRLQGRLQGRRLLL